MIFDARFFFKLGKLTTAAMSAVVLSSCKQNLSIETGSSGPNIKVPIVSLPSTSPYYSQNGQLLIQGVCKTGTIVLLSGPNVDQVNCTDSQFAFNVTQSSDGVYNYSISQSENNKISNPANLVWFKKTSVSQPSLTNPITNPYRSGEAVLNIQGSCETGATISLRLDGTGSATCANSVFSLGLPKFVDGDYNIEVVQTDQAGNEASRNFVWQKRALTVIPEDPQVIVGGSEVFNISGGAPPYTVVLTQNESVNGSYNQINSTYTAGHTSGGHDILQITDSQGFVRTVEIQVLADGADHFEYPTVSGDSQTTSIGQGFTDPLTIRVVDRFGNGVSNYPVVFQKTAGDVYLLGNMEQRTNAAGEASMSIVQGYTSIRSYVSVLPLIGPLPDILGTGRTRARFLLMGQSSNNGTFDLNFSVGSSPENTVVADINGDGFKDVLILNKNEPSISIKFGRGNGLFDSPGKLTGLCSGTSSMISSDFNNDGHVDLILTCTGLGQYSFISGRGDGTFNAPQNHLIDVAEGFPVESAIGDFNKDGFKDILIVSSSANVVAVRFGNNNGTFAAPQIYNAGDSPSKVVVGDFNKDTFDDFVVINAVDNSFGVYLNNGNGTFAAPVFYDTGSAPSSVVVSDFNSDTYLDIAVTNNLEDNLSVFLNANDGSFGFAINTAVGSSPTSMVVTDFNSDGVMDLAVTNIGDSTVSVLYGFDNGNFEIRPSLSTLQNPIAIHATDLNQDSIEDLLVVSFGESKFQVFPGQSNGQLGFITALPNGPVKSISADIDGDGFLDKALINQADNSISLHKGNGKGLFANLGVISVGNGPTDAVFVDLNKDSILDLVVVLNSANNIRVFLGQGGGAFNMGDSYTTQLQPTSLVHGDFNKDGFEDVIVTCSGANRINFFPGLGDGTLGTRTTAMTQAQPTHITTGDFNEDSILDVAIVNQSDGTVTVLLSSGNGNFLSSNFPVQDGPNGIISGFFNSDGHLDLAISNGISSTVSILKGRGDGTFDPATNFYSGPDPISIAKGDFNGNNSEDLIVGNGINQAVTILYGSPSADFSNYVTLITSVTSTSVSVDDLNNDRRVDITILDNSNSLMKVLLGQ